MNSAARTKRGQPLVVLGLVLCGWVAARAVMISSAGAALPVVAAQLAEPPPVVRMVPTRVPVEADLVGASATLVQQVAPLEAALAQPRPVSGRSVLSDQAARLLVPQAVTVAVVTTAMPQTIPRPEPVQPQTPVRAAAGHQLLWMAALAQLPLPSELAAPALQRVSAKQLNTPRWSGDGWLLWRRGGNAGLSPGGFSPPAYGASQVGAVLRYRLDPASPHRPALYLRATSALNSPRGEELALGLSARPIAKLPVVAVAELRATQFAGAIKLRPAAALISEFPPLDLPFKVRGEAYVQAGWVLGPGASRFVDGQVRLDRSLASVGSANLRIGGGLWGGAQRGASRLDAGPSATLALPLSNASGAAAARLAMDWRFRLAGNAAPRSGPAITLSAGF